MATRFSRPVIVRFLGVGFVQNDVNESNVSSMFSSDVILVLTEARSESVSEQSAEDSVLA